MEVDDDMFSSRGTDLREYSGDKTEQETKKNTRWTDSKQLFVGNSVFFYRQKKKKCWVICWLERTVVFVSHVFVCSFVCVKTSEVWSGFADVMYQSTCPAPGKLSGQLSRPLDNLILR